MLHGLVRIHEEWVIETFVRRPMICKQKHTQNSSYSYCSWSLQVLTVTDAFQAGIQKMDSFAAILEWKELCEIEVDTRKRILEVNHSQRRIPASKKTCTNFGLLWYNKPQKPSRHTATFISARCNWSTVLFATIASDANFHWYNRHMSVIPRKEN